MDSTDQASRFPLLEDDDLQNSEVYTSDGTVRIFGHGASKKHTGNWKACSLTLVCFFCSYLAFSSITKNLVGYLIVSLHETNVAAARNVSTWHGTSYLAPLVGAFLADSYLGQYWTTVIFCTIYIIGLVMLVLSAAVPLTATGFHVSLDWTDAVSSENTTVFVGLYMVAVGYGALNPCITSFGADQFDHTDEEERNRKSSFFNWRCFILNAASLISGTIIVWVQEREGWFWGFTIAAIFVALGAETARSPVARVCKVIVAATRNFNKVLPFNSSLLYEIPEQASSFDRSRKLEHTDGLEFFDKAAIVVSPDSETVGVLNTRGICTVTQVEELKILIRMLPIWITMILFSTILEQMYSTFVEQAMVMDKHIGPLEIPAASFQIVDVVAVLLLLPVYEKVLVPVLWKFTGVATSITPLQWMGISLVFSTLSIVSAALVETYRLQIAHAKGLVHRKVAVPVSILWQGPQYFWLGAGEVFSIGLYEFFYEEAPDALRSLCLAFSFASDSVGYYLSSLIISLVPVFTARGDSPGWIPDNLNEGRLDCFYWMMTVLSLLNLVAFVLRAMRYKSKKAY